MRPPHSSPYRSHLLLSQLGGRHHHEAPAPQLDASAHFKPPDDTELLLREWNRRREEGVADALRTNVKSIEESLAQLHVEAQQKLAYVNKAAQQEAARMQAQLERTRAEHAHKTSNALQSMRQGHDKQHSDHESKLQSLKEKRDAQERARLQEEAMRRAQEEERRRKEAEAEAQRQQAQRKKDEEDAVRAREAAAATLAAAAAANAAAANGGVPAPIGGATAAAPKGQAGAAEPERASARRQQRFEQADAALKDLADMQAQIRALPPEVMRVRPEMDRKIILNLNQVVATQEKCQAVIASILAVLAEASRMHPLLLLHCLNTIATRLVQKGQSVAAQPSSAFPYAFVAVGLCQKCPQLTKYLRASFYKICPYTIPRYVRRQEGWTDAQFLEAQGYEPNEGAPNGFEPEDEYRLRMGGTVMLWAAVLQTPEVFRTAHPFGIGEAWVWLATVGNMKPRRLTALFLHEFLKVRTQAPSSTCYRPGVRLCSLAPRLRARQSARPIRCSSASTCCTCIRTSPTAYPRKLRRPTRAACRSSPRRT